MGWAATPLGTSFAALAAANSRMPVHAGPPPAADPDGSWWSLAAYLADDGTALDSSIDRIGAFYGVPRRAAVAYFSRWWAMWAAAVAVFPLVHDRRTFLPRAEHLWLRHADWVDGVAVTAAPALVLTGDLGAADADVVADEDALRRRAMTWLVELAAPMVDALGRRATIAARQHWAAVADGIAEACVLAGESTGERDAAWAECEALLDLASPPLQLRPRRFVLDHDGAIEASVVKVQCDLAYLDGKVPRHFCVPCPIVKDDERRLRLIDERLHPH